MDALHKTLFQLALATGLWASQLHTLTHHTYWTTFTLGFSHVSFAPTPSHLAKNEREDHRVQPVLIPAWIVGGESHHLCLAWSLHIYMSLTQHAHQDNLFVWNDSLRWCSASNIASILRKVIDAVDHGKVSRVHESPQGCCKLGLSVDSLP